MDIAIDIQLIQYTFVVFLFWVSFFLSFCIWFISHSILSSSFTYIGWLWSHTCACPLLARASHGPFYKSLGSSLFVSLLPQLTWTPGLFWGDVLLLVLHSGNCSWAINWKFVEITVFVFLLPGNTILYCLLCNI